MTPRPDTGARQRRRAGFTLLEALCTLAVVALVLTAAFAALRMTVQGVERTETRLRRDRLLAGAADVLRHDLEGACVIGAKDMPALAGGEGGDGAILAFFTANSLVRRARPSPSGLHRVEYVLVAEGASGTKDLCRRETPWTPGRESEADASEQETLAPGVAEFRARFFDGTEWHDTWRRGTLPLLVRVALRLEGDDAEAAFYLAPRSDTSLSMMPALPKRDAGGGIADERAR